MSGSGAGDRDREFCEYVAARRPRLYRTAYLICGDAHHAEDLVQTALTGVYVAWRRLRSDGDIDAYVRRAIVNANVDQWRRRWRRELVGLGGIEPEARGGPPPEDVDSLIRALRELPPGQRRVVVLRHYWGLSVEETAADLGVSQGTVKSQTAAALGRLRELLKPLDCASEAP